MALYTVLERPGRDPRHTLFVPEGFAVTAFLFTVFWALWHRMWVVAALLLCFWAGMAAAVAFLGLDPLIAAAIEFGVALLFGFEARRLQVMSCRRAGYELTGIVAGASREGAELAYFGSRGRTLPPAPGGVPRLAEDHLGLFGTR